MKRAKLEQLICNYYIPLAIAVGGFGYVYQEMPVLPVILLLPAILLLTKTPENIIFYFYLAMTFLYAVLVRNHLNLPINVTDILAIFLCFSIFSFCAKNVHVLRHSRIFRNLVFFQLFISVVIGVLEANYYYGGGILPIRFKGANLNPNQLGLYAFSTWVIIWNLSNTRSFFKYLLCSFCGLVAVASGSDAIFAAISATLIARLATNRILKALGIFMLCILVVFSPLIASYFGLPVEPASQVAERLNRWLFVIPLLIDYPFALLAGLGPGPYGPSFANTFVSVVTVPTFSDLAETEFHNSVLDFFVSFGAIGVLVFGRTIARCCGRIQFSPLFFGLFTFSLFHLSYRHPIFWVAALFAISAPNVLFRGWRGRSSVLRLHD